MKKQSPCLKQGFSNVSDDQNHLENLLSVLAPAPSISDSGGVGVSKLCISNEFPGETDAVGLGARL